MTPIQPHNVGLYAPAWDSRGGSEKIDVLERATGTVSHSQTINAFANGRVSDSELERPRSFGSPAWTVQTAVLSALIRRGAPTAFGDLRRLSARARRGNGKGAYGADGYTDRLDSADYPHTPSFLGGPLPLCVDLVNDERPSLARRRRPAPPNGIAAVWTAASQGDVQDHAVSRTRWSIDAMNGTTADGESALTSSTPPAERAQHPDAHLVVGGSLTWKWKLLSRALANHRLSGSQRDRQRPVLRGVRGTVSRRRRRAVVGSDTTTQRLMQGSKVLRHKSFGGTASISRYVTVASGYPDVYRKPLDDRNGRALQKPSATETIASPARVWKFSFGRRQSDRRPDA